MRSNPTPHTLLSAALLFVVACVAAAQKPSSGAGASHPPPSAPAPRPQPGGTGQPSRFPNYFPYGTYYGVPEPSSGYNRLARQERQNRLVQDTDRLLSLTNQYQQLLQSTGPTPGTEKKLREIEKLAHQVRTALVQ